MRVLAAAFALFLLAAPIATAQPPHRLPRIGILADGTANPSRSDGSLQRFEDGLREHGYMPGSTVMLETRFAEGKPERLRELAAELVGLRVDVILAPSERGAIAARQATTTIPIVMVLGIDPIHQGLIDSLPRPGRNVTGLTADPGPDIIAKRLQLLRELVPGMRKVAVLTEPVAGRQTQRFGPLEEAARTSGVSLPTLEVQRSADQAQSFLAISKAQADAVLVSGAAQLYLSRAEVSRLALKHKVPAIYPLKAYAEAGGLISYGVDLHDLFGAPAASSVAF